MSRAKKFAEIRAGDGSTVVEVFVPGAEQDVISEGLRILTHRIELMLGGEVGGVQGFGGSFGYGIAFENDVFLMHPFCWCEKEDGSCLWCIHGDNPDFDRLLHERFGTQDYQAHRERRYYDPPHFWFKPSDFRVTWYKYIGRDNASNRNATIGEWLEMLGRCLDSIGAPPLHECIAAYTKACDEDAEEMKRGMEWLSSPEGQKMMDEMMEAGVIRTFTFGTPPDSKVSPC